MAFTSLPPLSLYIHIPWCVQKCPYCDFNSHAVNNLPGQSIPESDYIDALINDLNSELPAVWGRRLSSIFIGGGTPSLFSARSIDRLLSHIHAVMPTVSDLEITMEANPGTFEQKKFTDFHQAGINRLSIGIQSFNNHFLEKLGRIHDSTEAKLAIDMASKAGFDNYNLDLMYALPGQSPEQAMQDLNTAISLSPTHVSQYQLTIEPNTLFYSQPPEQLPENDLIYDMQIASVETLEQAGYQQYEVSAYAQQGRQCRHNLNYWQFGDYLGVGAGAHGKISRSDDNSINRYSKLKQPKAYMASAGRPETRATETLLSPQDIRFEFMMNAMRLRQGFEISLFEDHTGISCKQIKPELEQAQADGLLSISNTNISPTEKGYLFLNDLLMRFLDS